jgi:hypothetical protein
MVGQDFPPVRIEPPTRKDDVAMEAAVNPA